MAAEKRLAYDTEFKLKAIGYAKEHGNRPAAREFSINECMVRRWRQQEDDLRLTRKTKKNFRGHKARWPGLEDRLYHWISEQRAGGRNISPVAIQIQAKAISNQLHIEEFKAEASCCFQFMKQRQLSVHTRTTVCQQLPADYEEKLATFWSYCDFLTTTTIIRGFAKADIFPGLTSNAIESTEIDNSDSEDTGNVGSGLLDAPIAQLLISDMEDEEFEGFMEDEAADEVVDE
ncbi:hypothetical protein TURU_099624 [Turdus rufiventris]|nr:hypothetical protein TURU_099624 [Turdus rufiventris]